MLLDRLVQSKIGTCRLFDIERTKYQDQIHPNHKANIERKQCQLVHIQNVQTKDYF